MAAFPGYVTTLGRSLDNIIEAYRTGAGYGWHDHGDGARCGQAEANRPMFLSLLGPEYLASIPEVDAALRAGGRVADIGCGLGWSSIGIAKAFPEARVHGYDIDGPSIEQARVNADRGRCRRPGQLPHPGRRTGRCRRLRPRARTRMCARHGRPGRGTGGDEAPGQASRNGDRHGRAVGEHFTGEPDPIEQLIYGFSLICCLPDGRNAPKSAATGAVMRPPTLARYATDAGFTSTEILPLENDFFRFYHLIP